MARGRRVRRSVLVGTVSLGSLAAIAAQADGASNFGGLQYAGPNNFGGKSNISVPANSTTETVASNEILLHRVVTQGNGSAGVGLAQTGLYRSGPNTALDTCNTSVGAYTYYVETLYAGSGNYKCELYGNAPFNHDVNFKVAGDGSGGWYASGQDQTTGGSYAHTYTAEGFVTGFTAISTEMNDVGNQVADGTTSAATYGRGSNATPSWYVYQGSTGGSPHRVGSGETVQFPHTNPGSFGSSGTWSVPNVPTPVTFKHSP
jgi:hypothetical protein